MPLRPVPPRPCTTVLRVIQIPPLVNPLADISDDVIAGLLEHLDASEMDDVELTCSNALAA